MKTNSTPVECTILCRRCRYVLDGLGDSRCPECGGAFDPSDPATFLAVEQEERRRCARNATVRMAIRLCAVAAFIIVFAVVGGYVLLRLWAASLPHPDGRPLPLFAEWEATDHGWGTPAYWTSDKNGNELLLDRARNIAFLMMPGKNTSGGMSVDNTLQNAHVQLGHDMKWDIPATGNTLFAAFENGHISSCPLRPGFASQLASKLGQRWVGVDDLVRVISGCCGDEDAEALKLISATWKQAAQSAGVPSSRDSN